MGSKVIGQMQSQLISKVCLTHLRKKHAEKHPHKDEDTEAVKRECPEGVNGGL